MTEETKNNEAREDESTDEKLSKEELIIKLNDLSKIENGDKEDNHIKADGLLIEFIDDEEIEEAYNNISKWYA